MYPIKMEVLPVIAALFVLVKASADPSLNQLPEYKEKTNGVNRILTTANGAPVEASDTIGLNSDLINDNYFIETSSHQSRERIPERIVHAKGAGAFGYFEVTHNISHICKAKLFSEIGKKTPVLVRFSISSVDKGSSDTTLDSRGFAIKFYSEEGNFDIVGFHTPLFLYKEPLLFLPIGRVIKRNPVTNLKDSNMFWDLISLRPETLSFFIFLYGDNGIPDGYRYMPGFSIHTYQVYNEQGKSYFMRYHVLPDAGIRNLFAKEAKKVGCEDPDYAVRDLYNAIENGNFPSWTIYVQILTYEDVKRAKFDVFDITKILPENEYPLQPLGKLVLNRNPTNFFAEIEQAAFCPANLVPGILGAPDKAFAARRLAYKDAQLYRLGVNNEKIGVNCPYKSVYNYNRDGRAPVGSNGEDGPNYFPNSYNGPVPYVDKNRPKLIKIRQTDDSHNFKQIAAIYSKLSDEERNRMAGNLVYSIKNTAINIQRRLIGLFTTVHPDLAYRVTVGLAAAKSSC